MQRSTLGNRSYIFGSLSRWGQLAMAPPARKQIFASKGALPRAQTRHAITDIRRRRCRRNRRHRPVRPHHRRRREPCHRHRRVRHRRWGHRVRCRRHRRVRRRPWDRHHRCRVRWMGQAPRWTTEWSLASCYCWALCCRRPHIQPLGRAWRHHRKARQQFWLRISSDSPLSTRATFVQSTCRTPACSGANRIGALRVVRGRAGSPAIPPW